jgi:hypothetical protein
MKGLKVLLALVGIGIAAATVPHAAGAATIYESATLGLTNQLSGVSVADNQFVGVRFQLGAPVVASQIGGHFVGASQFFGAIVKLDSMSDFPDTLNLSSPDVLAHTLLHFPAPSADVDASIGPVTLTPGVYALVFGSGLFGATGGGAAPRDNTPVGSPSYFYWTAGNPTYLDDFNNNLTNTRFFLNGLAVDAPLPAVAWGGAALLGGLGITRNRRRRQPE